MTVRSVVAAGGIAEVVIDRPPVNAVDRGHLDTLAAVFAAFGRDDAVRGVVLHGTGGSFCAGIDMKAWAGSSDADRSGMFASIDRFVRAMTGLAVPFGVAVNGHALGGGFVIVLAADVRCVASGPIRLGLTEVAAGVPFPAEALDLVMGELDPASTRQLMLGGQILTPDEALHLRLVDVVAESEALMSITRDRVAMLAGQAGFAAVKRQRARARSRKHDAARAADPGAPT